MYHLFSMEWISWSGATNQIINDMLPIKYGGFWSTGSEIYLKQISHAISTSLPDTFSVSSDWFFSATTVDTSSAKQAQMIFHGSRSGAAVVTGVFENGTVIHWNMGGQWYGDDIWSDQTSQLLVNIVNFALDAAD